MRFTATTLVGRISERQVLEAALAGAERGEGSAVAVVGDAGIGKSRLVRDLMERTTAAVAAVGRASPGDRTPFRPLTEMLLAVTRHHDPAWSASTGALRSALARVVPVWGTSDTPAVGETPPPVIAEGILRLLTSTAGSGMALVALEDLHWADSDTLEVVRYLADNVAGSPLLLVLSMRPEPPDAASVASSLDARGAATVLHLDPLDRPDIDALVAACLDNPSPPDGLCRFIAERSEGNPLLVEELLAGLHTTGTLVLDEGDWILTPRIAPSVPLTFVDAVRQRVVLLDASTRAVLEAAAVVGRQFDHRVVGRMCGIKPDIALASLHVAATHRLVHVVDGTYQFRHALTRDAVMGLLPTGELERLASLAVEEMSAFGAGPDVLAELATMAGQTDRAASLLVETAAASMRRGALSTAESGLRAAEALTSDPDTRRAVAETLATTLVLAGKGDDARDVAHAALATWDGAVTAGDRRCKLRMVLARAEIGAGRWAEAEEQLTFARRTLVHSPDGGELEAQLAALEAHVLLNVGRAEEARVRAEEAVRSARASGAGEVACEALEVIGRHDRFLNPTGSSDAFARALRLADADGLGSWALRARHELAVNDAFIHWRFDALADVRRDAAEQGAMITSTVTDLHEAGTLLICGERDEGLAVAARCADACARYGLGMLPMAQIHIAAAHALSGDEVRAAHAATEAARLAPADLDVRSQALGWVHGNLALVAGDLSTWLVHLSAAMDLVRGDAGTIPSPWRAYWALLSEVEDQNPHARAEVRTSHASTVKLNGLLLDLADAVAVGRDGDGRTAEALFAATDERLGALERAPWPRHVARILVAKAAVAHEWGRPDELLREAEAYMSDAGYPGLASLTRALMREAGIPVPRRGRGDARVDPALRGRGITSREMDIWLLVAEGLTNREIAARLHLSVRTVEKYVAALLAKTGTANRRELARQLPAGST